MDRGVFDWSRWRRILPFRQFEEEGVLRMDLLSLRSSIIHMREEVVAEREELRSKEVQDLWHIGCIVLRGYEFGNECIEMMGILAYFHPTAVNALIFPNQDLVMMLKDLGFLTSTLIQENTTIYILISTKFPALIHEIRQKNLQHEVQFLRNIIGVLMSCKPFLQRPDLRTNEDVETLLHHSRHYRSLLERYAIDNVLIVGYVPNRCRYRSKQQQIAQSIYEKVLEMDDANSKTLLLQEALAYCVIGNNVWRYGIPDNGGDVCLGVRFKCLYNLGRCDEMVAYLKEIKEILMRHPFSPDMHWFPWHVSRTAEEMDGNASGMIMNELSIFLNHFYNTGGIGFREDPYILEWLIDYEADLGNWNRILNIMREKREYWRAHIFRDIDGAETWVALESDLFCSIKNSTDGLVDELVKESLEFMKQLVEYRLSDKTYGEKGVVCSPSHYFTNDPLFHVIYIFLERSRHEELLSYMLEYEKLLEDKYVDRIGPVTYGMLLFGEWLTIQLEFQQNTGNKLEELLEGVKAMSQNRMSIISNHPAEIKSWMEELAHVISSKCDSYLAQN